MGKSPFLIFQVYYCFFNLYFIFFQELLFNLGFPSVDHKIVNVNTNNEAWGLMDMQEVLGETMQAKKEIVYHVFVALLVQNLPLYGHGKCQRT